MKTFGGSILFLDRSDINTDEIIPAKYLTEIDKDALKPYLLEDLKMDGFNPASIPEKQVRVIVTRENFGCGSSREHAPWALEVNDITVVIAQNFARIFRQNMFNGGMLAIELEAEKLDKVFALQSGGDVRCNIDIESKTLTFSSENGETLETGFTVGEFDEALVKAGGWVEYADSRY